MHVATDVDAAEQESVIAIKRDGLPEEESGKSGGEQAQVPVANAVETRRQSKFRQRMRDLKEALVGLVGRRRKWKLPVS